MTPESDLLETDRLETDRLETDRLVLEPLTVAHARELFAAYQDAALYRFIPHEPPATLDALEARFARQAVRCSPCRAELWLNWILRLKDGGAAIGRVELTIREDRSALFAYELAVAHQGHGLATEACRAVIEHLFAEYPVHTLVAEVDTRNTASIRLLERLSFARVGEKRDADFFHGETSHEYRFERRRP